jgi:hypothetical protein
VLVQGDPNFPGSVVWKRLSYFFKNLVESATYALVQVIDGDGNKIEPAWSLFADYQKKSDWDNDTPVRAVWPCMPFVEWAPRPRVAICIPMWAVSAAFLNS